MSSVLEWGIGEMTVCVVGRLAVCRAGRELSAGQVGTRKARTPLAVLAVRGGLRAQHAAGEPAPATRTLHQIILRDTAQAAG